MGVEPKYARDLKEQYANERIVFKGGFHTDDLSCVLQMIDVLVCPSVWLENAPLVIQEAQAAGLPVITSDCGGMAELVRDGVDGFRFPVGNSKALQDVLQRIIDYPAMLFNLLSARDRVRDIGDDADFCLEQYQTFNKVDLQYPCKPAPWRLTLITNPDKCNLRCVMCDTFSEANRFRLKECPRQELDFETAKRTICSLLPYGLREIIPSTMGEPLLYSHFEELVELCRSHGLKINLTTNGTFPGKGVAYWAEKLIPLISDVKFSLNGINPDVNERIMCGTNTETQLSNIRYWIAKRNDLGLGKKSTVTIQCVFMKSNLNELKNIVHWGIENGVDRIKGHHLWKTAECLEDEMLRNEKNVFRWNLVCEQCKRIANGKVILQNFEPINSLCPDDNPSDAFCPFLGQELWLEYDNSYQICCCPGEVRKGFGDFGNASELSAIEMWNSSKYRDFLLNWGGHENCKKCNMRIKR